ncbi:MAG TPA: multidrug effflux MFS transporter, partial [Alphaproteobacteria bacterium]
DLKITNPNHAQYIISFIFFGMAMGEIISGPLSDAWGRKEILFIGIGLFLVGSITCYCAATLPVMLAGRMLQGIGVAGPYIASVSIVRDKFSGRDMARVMSLVMMVFMAVPAVAPTVGQGIMLYTSWRYIFLMYIVYSVLVGLWILFRLEETLPVERRIPFSWHNLVRGFKEVVTNRITMGYTMVMCFVFGGFMGYLNSCQQIFQGLFNTGKMFTLYFSMLAIVLAVSSFVNSAIVKRLGMQRICFIALSGLIVASMIFLILQLFVSITLWMFMLYAVAVFFAFGLVMGNINAMAMEPMGHIAGIASAIISSLTSLIPMVIGSIIGQLYNNTLFPITIGFVVFGICGLVTLIHAGRGMAAPLEDPVEEDPTEAA